MAQQQQLVDRKLEATTCCSTTSSLLPSCTVLLEYSFCFWSLVSTVYFLEEAPPPLYWATALASNF